MRKNFPLKFLESISFLITFCLLITLGDNLLASLNSLKRLAALIACAMLLEALETDETALLTSLNVSWFCDTKSATLLAVSTIPSTVDTMDQ